MDSLIFNTLRAVRQESDEDKRVALKAESNAALGQHFSRSANRADLEELAFDLLNAAWADALTNDITGQVIEVKTVGLGDVDYIEEDLRGMRAYWQGKGGQILSDIVRYERSTMPREEMVTAIDLHSDEIELDFWGGFDKLASHAREKLAALPLERLVELIQAAIAGGNYYATYAASTLTSAQVDTILDRVADKSEGAVTIIGQRQAVRKLANVGLEFGDNVKERVFETGQVGVYKGYPVVQVGNSENFSGDKRLPTDELWLVGQRSGRLTYYGSTPKVQTLPRPSFYIRWETARDAGMLLYGAEKGRIGRIKLT